MKKLAFRLIMVLNLVGIITITGLNAQTQTENSSNFNGKVGLRFMPTFSNLDFQTSDGGTVSGEATLGFGFGLMGAYNFSEHIGLQGELIYSSITQKYEDREVEREFNVKYINIPLLLSLNTGISKPVNLNAVLGPQIGFNVGSGLSYSNVTDTTGSEPVLSVKKGDLGFAYGAGIDFGLNPDRTFRLSIGYRGVIGLLDISDDNTSTTTNSYYILDRTYLSTKAAYIGASYLF